MPHVPPVVNVPPVVQLDAVQRHTNQSQFVLSGSTTGLSSVQVVGGSATGTGSADVQGAFTVSVPLNLNQENDLSVIATSPAGLISSAVSVTLVHDGVVPTLSVQEPSGSSFDTDGDSRVNIAFSFGDSIGGIETISVTNDRPIGGGTSIGGVDAGTNLLTAGGDSVSVGLTDVTYNASLDHEFLVGTNILTFIVADSAGNMQTDTVEFTVSGTEPIFRFTQPNDGDVLPWPGFVIAGEFIDVAGIIDYSDMVIVADRPLIALLSQDGTQRVGAEAGENLNHESANAFSFTDVAGSGWTIAEARDDGSYAFPAGATTMIGHVNDRAGNASQFDTVTVTFPALPHTLLVVNSSTAPGTTEHVVPIGFTSFNALGGVQFSINLDPSVLTVDSLKSAGRVSASPFFEVSDNGQVDIVLVDLSGDPIREGSDVVVNIYTSVSAQATAQDLALTLSDVEVADGTGNPVGVVVQDGVLEIRE